MARRSRGMSEVMSGNSPGWRERSCSYENARMPRAAAIGASREAAGASNTNVDACASSIKYSNSGLVELSGNGTATPPARQMPHCAATQGNPGVIRKAMRSS